MVFQWKQKICLKIPIKKLSKKNLDMVVANNLKDKGAGFGTDTNLITIITKDNVNQLPLMPKEDVANSILDEILKIYKIGFHGLSPRKPIFY